MRTVAFGDTAVSSEMLQAFDQSIIAPNRPSFTEVQLNDSLSAQIYEALKDAKVLTSQVAAHLDDAFRKNLFTQLDRLHDPDEWEDGDLPVKHGSFDTFLRMIVSLKPTKRPGLGLTSGGCLIGAWTAGPDRLTLEFRPNDNIRWMASVDRGGWTERAAGDTRIERLERVLSNFDADRWFARGPGPAQA